MITIKEKYEDILKTKFTGAGGIVKKYVIVIFKDGFVVNEFEYDTEEEATIVYGGLLKKYEMHNQNVLLTIRYYPSL